MSSRVPQWEKCPKPLNVRCPQEDTKRVFHFLLVIKIQFRVVNMVENLLRFKESLIRYLIEILSVFSLLLVKRVVFVVLFSSLKNHKKYNLTFMFKNHHHHNRIK